MFDTPKNTPVPEGNETASENDLSLGVETELKFGEDPFGTPKSKELLVDATFAQEVRPECIRCIKAELKRGRRSRGNGNKFCDVAIKAVLRKLLTILKENLSSLEAASQHVSKRDLIPLYIRTVLCPGEDMAEDVFHDLEELIHAILSSTSCHFACLQRGSSKRAKNVKNINQPCTPFDKKAELCNVVLYYYSSKKLKEFLDLSGVSTLIGHLSKEASRTNLLLSEAFCR